MKHTLITLFMFVSLATNAQHLLKVTHHITGDKWKETTWEPFIRKGFKTRNYEVNCRLRKQDKLYFFELQINKQIRTHLVDEGNVIAFMSDNDKVLVALKCTQPINSRSDNDIATYPITKEEMEIILNEHVKDVKMQYRKGYTVDGLTERKLRDLRNAIMLITMNKRYDDKPVTIKEVKR